MTNERLAAIEARVNAAQKIRSAKTPFKFDGRTGEGVHERLSFLSKNGWSHRNGELHFYHPNFVEGMNQTEAIKVTLRMLEISPHLAPIDEADALLIAHAREDIPALLEYVKQLQNERDHWKDEYWEGKI